MPSTGVILLRATLLAFIVFAIRITHTPFLNPCIYYWLCYTYQKSSTVRLLVCTFHKPRSIYCLHCSIGRGQVDSRLVWSQVDCRKISF